MGTKSSASILPPPHSPGRILGRLLSASVAKHCICMWPQPHCLLLPVALGVHSENARAAEEVGEGLDLVVIDSFPFIARFVLSAVFYGS